MKNPARQWLRKITQDPLLNKQEVDDLLDRGDFRSRHAEYPKTVAYRRIGEARSVYHGDGMDYEESRPYEYGDELRFMNWRLTARTGQFQMKVFRAEKRPGVYIMLDRRSSMRFGSHVRLKAAQAARIAILTAWTAHRNQSSVGTVILDPNPVWHEQSQSEVSVLGMIQAMCDPCPPLTRERGQASLADVMRHMNALLPLGSQVCLISDFSDLDETHRADLFALSVNHQVTAVHVLDHAEMQVPELGVLQFADPFYNGHHEQISLDTTDARFRDEYKQSVQAHLDRIRASFSALDISYRQVYASDDSIMPAISSF